jgi:hypothetical protein
VSLNRGGYGGFDTLMKSNQSRTHAGARARATNTETFFTQGPNYPNPPALPAVRAAGLLVEPSPRGYLTVRLARDRVLEIRGATAFRPDASGSSTPTDRTTSRVANERQANRPDVPADHSRSSGGRKTRPVACPEIFRGSFPAVGGSGGKVPLGPTDFGWRFSAVRRPTVTH